MKRLVATIIAVPGRAEFAEQIRCVCVNKLGLENVALFLSQGRIGREAAMANVRAALEWQTREDAEWNLFLEDDQRIYPGCFEAVERLLKLADELNADAFYTSNRSIRYLRQELRGGFVLNRLNQPVLGSHGLLYRRKELHAWSAVAADVLKAPIDTIFFQAVPPNRRRIYQVVAPILMQHVGVESNLNTYRHNEQLCLNGVEPETLCRIPQNL